MEGLHPNTVLAGSDALPDFGYAAVVASGRSDWSALVAIGVAPTGAYDMATEILNSELAGHKSHGSQHPRPGLGTDEHTMAWMMDSLSIGRGHTSLGVVTGKPLALGGSLARARDRHVARRYARDPRCHAAARALPARTSVAVQGCGKVGRYTARFFAEAGARVIAVSDQYRAIHAAGGLEVPAVEAWVDRHGTAVGFPAADPLPPANAGGVVVSYFEWVQANQAFWWSEREVEDRLAPRMTSAWVRTTAFAAQRALRSTTLAVKSVADAHRARGLYP